MSRGGFWTAGPRAGARRAARNGDADLLDSVSGALTDPFDGQPLGVTAERIAERAGISRARQDAFAAASHRRAAAARAAGRFDEQVVPVEVPARTGTRRFDRDEQIREDASVDAMAALDPVFAPGGTI